MSHLPVPRGSFLLGFCWCWCCLVAIWGPLSVHSEQGLILHLPCRISQPELRSGSNQGPPARPRPPQWHQATELQVMHGSKVRMGELGSVGVEFTLVLGCQLRASYVWDPTPWHLEQPGTATWHDRCSLGLVPIPARAEPQRCALRGKLCLCLAGGGSPHAAWLVPLSLSPQPAALGSARPDPPSRPLPPDPVPKVTSRQGGRVCPSAHPRPAACLAALQFLGTSVTRVSVEPLLPSRRLVPVLLHLSPCCLTGPLSLPRPLPRRGHPPPHARCLRTLCC